MKKTISVIALLLCAVFGYAQDNHYRISGTIEGLADGEVVEITPLSVITQPSIARATVTNGQFCMEGSVDEPTAVLLLIKGTYASAGFMINPGCDIRFTAGLKEENNIKLGTIKVFKDEKVENSPLTDQLKAFIAEAGGRGHRTQEMCDSMVLAHKDTFWGAVLMVSLSPVPMSITKDQFNVLSETAKNSVQGRAIHDFLYPKEWQVGDTIKPFELKDEEGKVSNIFDLIKDHKYTLIDFWASWCIPCRKEMQNIKKYYAAYKDKGFNVISISVDRDRKAWEKANGEEQVPWLSCLDTMGAAEIYQILFVPALYIVDAQGCLVAPLNLHTDKLRQHIEQLMQ
ncbi:MAG: AhpC/TSA family protein [Prevotella sp.]|nr:AhpC/TSA family protein [Prevotella sp.]